MSTLGLEQMRRYLSRTISSMNRNKLTGLLAKIDLRHHLAALGFSDRVSVGGLDRSQYWCRQLRTSRDCRLSPDRGTRHRLQTNPISRNPPIGLHTICSSHFRQLGIQSYFCIPSITAANASIDMTWRAKELGIPWEDAYREFPANWLAFSGADGAITSCATTPMFPSCRTHMFRRSFPRNICESH